MSPTESFFLGLGIGVAGSITGAIFVFRNNKKKIAESISVLADKSLDSDQKIKRLRAIWGV